MFDKGSFTVEAHTRYALPYIATCNNINTQAIANNRHVWIWHLFEPLYSIGHCERQIIMYLLDLRVSCCTYLYSDFHGP